MNSTEEAQFERVLLDAVEEAKKLKYRPSRFVGMIQAKGAFQTVKDIVASGKPSEGFDKLVLFRRIDLTCEAIIVETLWRRFFDEDLLKIAEDRLSTYKYKWRIIEASSESSVSLDVDNFIVPEDDRRERSLRQTHLRNGQVEFRNALIAHYGARCSVTGVTIPEALEAAHICAYRGEESNHLQNGLLLRADLHKLFDRYLFSVDPSSLKIQLSTRLKSFDAYKAQDGKALDIGNSVLRPSRRALEIHWMAYIEQNLDS